MRHNNSPGLGQWISVSLMVAVSLFLLLKLYQYAGARSYYPAGLTIAGVDVGGLARDEAGELIVNRYGLAPVVIYHGENSFELSPASIGFELDMEGMLTAADNQRSQQDFWAGFWGFIWNRAIEVDPVYLMASHSRDALRDELLTISSLADEPAQPPQPLPQSLTFAYGTPGTLTNIEASFDDIEAAFYRPSNREARLQIDPRQPERADISLLARLLVNRLQVFEQETGGTASVFIMDLDSGEVVNINDTVAMSAIDTMRLPVVLDAYRAIEGVPTLSQREMIGNTLVVQVEEDGVNSLLNVIAGEEDPYQGAAMVSEGLQRMGLANSFMLTPFEGNILSNQATPQTLANSVEGLRTRPDAAMQTTAEDMGLLLSMFYYCSEGIGGTLEAVFNGAVTQDECGQILDIMQQNHIGSLIEEGVPPDTPVAHRHGWVSDTHADAGVVYSPGGDYVLVTFFYKPDWLEWELSAPLMADISRATYNFFNFDTPYTGESQLN